MATFTLDSLKDEISKKYEPTIIQDGDTEFVLQNLLQLPAKKRAKVMSLLDDLDTDAEDVSVDDFEKQVAAFQTAIETVEQNGQGKELLKRIGDNTALLIEIASEWMERSQVGEAEQS